MDKWKQEKGDEVEKENIIFTVKYSLEHSNHQEKIEKLQEVIRNNDNEIKRICSNNQNHLLQNLKQFSEINADIVTVHESIKGFENDLETLVKMNIYNSSKACQLLEAKTNIDSVASILQDFKEVMFSLEKATDSIKADNFLGCLRILNSLKKKSFFQHPAGPSIRKIFNKLLPLITAKIRKLTDDMIKEWTRYLKNKKSEYAQFLVNIIEEMSRKKTTRLSNIKRTNTGRESLSVMDLKLKSNIPKSRGSILSFKQQNSQRANPSERKTTQIFGMDAKFTKFASIQKDFVKENANDLKIDYYLFNQCKQIFENLDEQQTLYEQLKDSRKYSMLQICEPSYSMDPKDIKSYLANILGFFLIQKEIERHIPQIKDINQLWIEAGRLLEYEINRIFEKSSEKQDYFLIKSDLQIYTVIFTKQGFNSQGLLLNDLIKLNYVKFSEDLIKKQIMVATKKIQQDKCDSLVIKNPSQLKEYVLNYQIDKILNLGIGPNMQEKYPMYLNYSIIIPELCDLILEFINDNVEFMQGTLDNESLLVLQLDRMLFEVYQVYYEQLTKNLPMYTPLQLAQIYQNASILEMLSGFFKLSLEKASSNKYTNEFESNNYCEQIKYLCDEQICEKMKERLKEFMNGYAQMNWTPNNISEKCSDTIEDVLNYLINVLSTMKQILPESAASNAFVAIKYFNDQIMDIFVNKVKHFNVAGLYNLETDIAKMLDICTSTFQEFDGLAECLKEVRQFLELFLTGPIEEFADVSIRSTKYSYVDPQKILIIGEKYKKIILKNAKELRKRHVDAMLKELKKEYKKK